MTLIGFPVPGNRAKGWNDCLPMTSTWTLRVTIPYSRLMIKSQSRENMEALGNSEVLAEMKGHSTGPEGWFQNWSDPAHINLTDGKKVAMRPPTEHCSQRQGQVLH